MERFYSDVINVLKEDAKKLSKQIESSSDSKQKIEKLRILKDTMDLVFRYEDKVEKEEKSTSVSYGKDKNSFVNYYDMFKTILENGIYSCVLNTYNSGKESRGTGKSYSLLKFAKEYNGVYVGKAPSADLKEFDTVFKFTSKERLKVAKNILICFDENTLDTEDIKKLELRGNKLFGFIHE